jgi:glycosyltransferase involved in cell wall biosynthesis
MHIDTLLFRHMLPRRLFPGWRRVGNSLSTLQYSEKVDVTELLDWYNPFSWVEASCIIRRADVVIFQWWTSSVAHMYLALQILNYCKRPVLIEFHEVVDPFEHSVVPIRLYSRLMGRLIRRFADCHAAHSEHDRRLIAAQYQISEERIRVIPHGLYDHYPLLQKDAAKKEIQVQGSFVFLFFGLLRPYKGVIHLIHAFEQLPQEIIRSSFLVIVGESWEDMVSVEAASQSPVSDRIRLINRYVSDEEVPTFFSAADALILPYIRASQSGVAHIGISYGLPIIASQVGGIAESLSGYDGSVFIPPSDEQTLSKAMEQVYHADQCKFPVPEHLRWETVADQYYNTILDLVRGERV